MGFSVSGGSAVIILGLVVSISMVSPMIANSYSTVSDARSISQDLVMDKQSTEISIIEVRTGESVIEVKNTGQRTLNMDDISVLVDEDVTTVDIDSSTISGYDETNVWKPGEVANIAVEDLEGDRVTVVTDVGVLDRSDV